MTMTTQETPIKSLLEEVISTHTPTRFPQITTSALINHERYSGNIGIDCKLELYLRTTYKDAKNPKCDLCISVYDMDAETINACLNDEQYVRFPKTALPGHTTFTRDHEETRIEYHKKTAEEIRSILKTTIPLIQELAPMLRKANWGITIAVQHGYKIQEY